MERVTCSIHFRSYRTWTIGEVRMATEVDSPLFVLNNWFRSLGQKRIRIVRLISQITFLFVLNGTFIGLSRIPAPLPIQLPVGSPFVVAWGGFQAMQYVVSRGQFPFLVLGVFFLTGAVFGRMFCGWACPVGFWQDLMSWLPIPKVKIGRTDNRGLVFFAWSLVVISLAVLGISGLERLGGTNVAPDARNQMFFDSLDPMGFLFGTLYYAFSWGNLTLDGNFISSLDNVDWWVRIKLIILIIMAFVSMKVPRAYCRWICPTGAILGACSRYSILTVKVNENASNDEYSSYAAACPMGVSASEFTTEGINDSLCTSCGNCIDAHPDSLSFGIRE